MELVRLVGIAMIGSAALLAFSAVLIWRATPARAHLAMIIGAIYVVLALSVVDAGQWWDAGFYGIAGVALVVLSAAVRWLQGSPRTRRDRTGLTASSSLQELVTPV